MNRLFYFNGNYVLLQNGVLKAMTEGETETFCRVNRSTTLTGFIHPDEARTPPAFWSESDLRLKAVRLDESFRSTVTPMLDRELNGIYPAVRGWLLSIDATLISYFSQIPT